MKKETNLSECMTLIEYQELYDASLKELLADKQVLARILKYTLDEFKDMEFEDIMNCIDNVEVSRVNVDPGFTNKIFKSSEEDSIPGEGKVYFDIRFTALIPEGPIKILVNIEAQKSTRASKLGYHLDNRILYYLARMVSSQKKVEFIHSDYDNIKAVRSIWICLDTADDEDSINRIRLAQDVLYGKPMSLPNISKVQAIIVRLRQNLNAAESKNKLIAMLEDLIRSDELEHKKAKLESEYGLVMDVELAGRMNTMCNISEVIIEQAMKDGTAKGLEQGLERGLEQGRTEGHAEGRLFEIFSSIHDGDYSAERGAQKLGITVEQLTEQFAAAGFMTEKK